ncbi:sensor domain-containing diguanylate cyclase [Alkalilimnicola ehrlichii]|uniref:sensor domain-containing diguanylate cyclase n=1 Tax=Alkalilimnicola ehrlichii TaxID=351052 RepID=UPI003BA1B6C0
MLDARLARRLELAPGLPTLPAAAMRLVELGNQPDVGTADLAEVIGKDPALSVRILKVANSPFYARRREVTNVRQALVTMGMNAAVTLALSFTLIPTLQQASEQGGYDRQRYWRRSLLAAAAAREIGRRQCLMREEDLMLAGLVQDLGILVLDVALKDEYRQIAAAAQCHDSLAAAERAALGCDHADVAAWLMGRWGLPGHLVEAVAGSHQVALDVASPTTDGPTLLRGAVALSGAIADVWLADDTRRAADRAAQQVARALGWSAEEVQALLEAVGAAEPELARLFEIRLDDPESTAGVLEQAREALILQNLRMVHEVVEVREQAQAYEQQVRELEERTRRDPLTGLYNRDQLFRRLQDEFTGAAVGGWPLTLVVLDLDHFKQVNDEYGHLAGDQVLRRVSAVLHDAVRGEDVVARYGGEEFVLLLPGVHWQDAQRVVRRVLERVRGTDLGLKEAPQLRVTASAGLAVQEGGRPFVDTDSLVAAADQALYTAKNQGRNRLVVDPVLREHA